MSKTAEWMLQYQTLNHLTFDDMLDAFTELARLQGNTVIVDGLEWDKPNA